MKWWKKGIIYGVLWGIFSFIFFIPYFQHGMGRAPTSIELIMVLPLYLATLPLEGTWYVGLILMFPLTLLIGAVFGVIIIGVIEILPPTKQAQEHSETTKDDDCIGEYEERNEECIDCDEAEDCKKETKAND